MDDPFSRSPQILGMLPDGTAEIFELAQRRATEQLAYEERTRTAIETLQERVRDLEVRVAKLERP